MLEATAELGAGATTAAVGETAALVDSLRDTVGHVEAAARAVQDGKLEQVLSETRRKLEHDLDLLRGVHEGCTGRSTRVGKDARRADHTPH